MNERYSLGDPPIELQMLVAQARAIEPITKRLLDKAGLRPGMEVLDVGCGAGDLSLLAADFVGRQGFVTGVDVSANAVAFATRRAAEARCANVSFRVCDTDLPDGTERFDFIVGRHVVMHQKDPVGFIRSLAKRLRPGGIIAFHEIDTRRSVETSPAVPFYDEVAAEVMAAIRVGTLHPEAASRLAAIFAEAGLPEPEIFCERPVGTARTAAIHAWAAMSLAGIRELEGSSLRSVNVPSLQNRLENALAASNAQIVGADQCCAWAIVPAPAYL